MQSFERHSDQGKKRKKKKKSGDAVQAMALRNRRQYRQ
jgi:hypothetical protein